MKFSARGFTLIELLVVIAIISLLSLMGFVNFKDTAAEQVITRALGQVQTQLRLAQSNATSSTLCAGFGSIAWYLSFTSDNTIELNCNNGAAAKTYTLENAKLAITGTTAAGGSECTIADGSASYPFPVILSYSAGVAKQSISVSSSSGASSACLESAIIKITVSNTKNSTITAQSLKISPGGGINVK